ATTSVNSLTSSDQTLFRITVPANSANKMTDEHAKTILGLTTGRHSPVYRKSSKKGKQRATPANGKYSLCSKTTWMMETPIENNDRVRKKQELNKAQIGYLLRILH